MKIAVIGTGYVGLVSAACFAELGHTVVGVDIDEAKVKMLESGKSPIYEPGLEELLKRNMERSRLSFTTDITEVLPSVSIVFSAVATPPDKDSRADLKAVFAVADTVATHADHDLLFVNKSTVPVGTGQACEERIAAILKERKTNITISVVSNPEFLREGMAVTDTLMPERIIVGINGNESARTLMEKLYDPITRVGKPLLFMSRESAEIVKYASNAFLATKISFINMIAELAEKTGGDVRDIARGMGLDSRIGPRFLHAGIGYGGSCFPKDVKALIATGKETDIATDIVEATERVNERQRRRFLEKVLGKLPKQSTVAVWGLSFKPKTDDMRDAPSIEIVTEILKAGHAVRAFDPAGMEQAKRVMPKELAYCTDHEAAAKDADALLVLTEWDEFRGADMQKVKSLMKGNLLFDGRNIYEPQDIAEAGLTYIGMGIA